MPGHSTETRKLVFVREKTSGSAVRGLDAVMLYRDGSGVSLVGLVVVAAVLNTARLKYTRSPVEVELEVVGACVGLAERGCQGSVSLGSSLALWCWIW